MKENWGGGKLKKENLKGLETVKETAMGLQAHVCKLLSVCFLICRHEHQEAERWSDLPDISIFMIGRVKYTVS